jgi:hypothetical protein
LRISAIFAALLSVLFSYWTREEVVLAGVAKAVAFAGAVKAVALAGAVKAVALAGVAKAVLLATGATCTRLWVVAFLAGAP